jgi:hypothetical protein
VVLQGKAKRNQILAQFCKICLLSFLSRVLEDFDFLKLGLKEVVLHT